MTPQYRKYFKSIQGVIHCDGVSVEKLAKQFGTPLYVYSERAFLEPFDTLKKGLSKINSLICFATKSNSNLEILRTLAKHGSGADVVSGGELFRAREAGIPPKHIVFSGVGKTDAEIRDAILSGPDGIFSFHIESIEEAAAINRVAASLKKTVRAGVRFNPDVDAKTHPYISTGLKENKFGLNRAEVTDLVRVLRSLPYIQLDGVSVHIGSQILTLAPMREAFQKARELFHELSRSQGRALRFFDGGGGVGIQYGREKTISISDYTRLLMSLYSGGDALPKSTTLVLEPGRLIIGNSGILLTRVLYRKRRKQKDFLIVDAGMNDLMRPSLYRAVHQIEPVCEPLRPGSERMTDVVGPVCESSDCFAQSLKLSESITSSDLLAIFSAGAYGASMSSQYNSRPRAAEVLVSESKKPRLIRERETYEDLLVRERFRGQKAKRRTRK